MPDRKTPSVRRHADCDADALAGLLARYGLRLEPCPDDAPIPGSFWGDEEAGLVGNRLLVRSDTPVHSALHEACHYICMDAGRRAGLDTDAGGDYDEENAVCYLQIVLAGELPGFDRARMMADMDAWGYSFRLGSAQAWFEQDADDARAWLLRHDLIDASDRPTYRLRMGPE
jgi:hypothetical protein